MEHVITPAQEKLFDLALRASTAINKVINTQLAGMLTWLKEQYGENAPTYTQFWADRDALKHLAADRGLSDDQWVRKPYNMAVKELYGALPVSTTIAAVAKRAVRPQAQPAGANGAPKPATRVIKVALPKDATEAVRQMLAHYGMAQVLLAFSTVLAEHRDTAKEAARVKTLGEQFLTAAPAPAAKPATRRAVH